MLGRLKLFWDVLKHGRSVADPSLWKRRQVTVTMVGAFIWAVVRLLEGYGVSVPIDEDTVDGIAIGVLALVNWVLTLATSEKVGLSK